jgi:hypothetical protein
MSGFHSQVAEVRWSRDPDLNRRPVDRSRYSMLLNRLAFSCVNYHGFVLFSGRAVLLLFPNFVLKLTNPSAWKFTSNALRKSRRLNCLDPIAPVVCTGPVNEM